MTMAPAASRNVLCWRGAASEIILIAPVMMPAAPVPETVRPMMNRTDEWAAADSMDPTI